MIYIAVCDDDALMADKICMVILNFFHKKNNENRFAKQYNIEVAQFLCGEALLESDKQFDIVFLDIQMKLVNGLRTAERKVGIIFLTTLTQCALEGYKYQATNYIIKPMKYVRLKAEMDDWRKHNRKNDSPAIVVANDSGKYKIFLNTLRYVETFNRNLLVHTEQENIICYRSMKELEQELAEHGFVRCHTSYIVNLFFVKGVNKLEITLVTGEIIPISQPKRKQFMEQLAEYWGNLL